MISSQQRLMFAPRSGSVKNCHDTIVNAIVRKPNALTILSRLSPRFRITIHLSSSKAGQVRYGGIRRSSASPRPPRDVQKQLKKAAFCAKTFRMLAEAIQFSDQSRGIHNSKPIGQRGQISGLATYLDGVGSTFTTDSQHSIAKFIDIFTRKNSDIFT